MTPTVSIVGQVLNSQYKWKLSVRIYQISCRERPLGVLSDHKKCFFFQSRSLPSRLVEGGHHTIIERPFRYQEIWEIFLQNLEENFAIEFEWGIWHKCQTPHSKFCKIPQISCPLEMNCCHAMLLWAFLVLQGLFFTWGR